MFDRFIRAQDKVYGAVQDELRAGCKRGHWMWFIFPQLLGLGTSITAAQFALRGLSDAEAYAQHPLLGERLRECVILANAIEDRSARQVFGYPDDLKYRSCLTLFLIATSEDVFRAGLEKYYSATPDSRTLELLRQ